MPSERIAYKRSRFSTRLPADRLYTASHYWLWQQADGHWRVGLSKFAMRMLGEIVEFDFESKPGDDIALGAVIGWIEGFKASSDIYSVMTGKLLRYNGMLDEDPSLLYRRMYDEGWFYEASGEPDGDAMDVQAYTHLLDTTIDRMQELQQ